MPSNRFLGSIDIPLLLTMLAIMLFGVLNIYSVDAAYGIKQLTWIGLGGGMVLVMLVITSLSRNFFDLYAPIFYVVGVLLLIGVLIFGIKINGARAWYNLGGIRFQPVEVMKIATALMLSNVLNNINHDLRNRKTVILCLALIAIPCVLILLQPDVGSIFVFGAFFLAMYREGLNPWILLIPIFLGLIFLFSIAVEPIVFLVAFLWTAYIITVITTLFSNKADFGQRLGLIISGIFLGIALCSATILGYKAYQFLDVNISELFFLKKDFLICLFSSFITFFSLLSSFIAYRSKKSYDFKNDRSSSNLSSGMGTIGITTALTIVFTGISALISLSAPTILDKLPTHQRERIMVLFEGEAKYRDTSGYNLLYSKTAIGSGELFGAGWNKGTVTDGRFVPEQWTDYIFCTVGEEWGFVGSTILVLAYAFLIGRIYWLAEQQNTVFARFFGYCVGSILLLHYFVNIGMVMGLFPTVGIPLPFLSYGGSSLWGFMLLIFIFVKLNYDSKKALL